MTADVVSSVAADLIAPLWSTDRLPPWTDRQWETAFGQARHSRMLARMAQRIVDQGWLDAVPERPRDHLLAALRTHERQRDLVRWETGRLLAALRELRTPVVLLKGAAYVMAGLPPARGRLFSDIDILLPREHLIAAESALLAHGWVRERLEPYDDRYYRQWMHELPPLQHVERNSCIDVHHTIAPPTSRWRIPGDKLLERRRALPNRPQLHVLAPEDMVLHGALHLMQEGDFSAALRDTLDFTELVRHFAAQDAGFWPQLLDRARELGLQGPLHHVSRQARRLFALQVGHEVANALEALVPRGPVRSFMHRSLDCALRPDHPSADTAFTPWARQALYIRSHWLRMPWHQILPHLARKAVVRAWARYRQPSRTQTV